MMTTPDFPDDSLRSAFAAYPPDTALALLHLRALIYATAAETTAAGQINETLKWGQPAYLTTPRTGSTIRLGCPKKSLAHLGDVAIFTHCQTTIMSEFQALCPPAFTFDGNRALILQSGNLPFDAQIRPLISMALTYHRA